MNEINLRLREIRRARNLSQEELAEKLGVSRQAIIALEQGASLPSLPVLLALMRVLDLPFSRLFQDDWKPFRGSEKSEPESSTRLGQLRQDTHQSIPIHLTENDNFITVQADLPGVKEEDITIDLSQQHALILATRKTIKNEADLIHINEIQSGPLARILSLPSPIDTEKASAHFEHGILTLTLPKFLPTTKRRITFKPTKSN